MQARITQAMNPVQMMIINSFATATSQREEEELRDLLLNYYNRKMQDEFAKLWDEGTLDQKQLDALRNEHFRTSTR